MGIIKFHVALAGFFLPVALVFAVTGGLYTFEIRGGYRPETKTINLDLPADPGLEQMIALVPQVLEQNFVGANVPSGKAGLRKVGTSWSFDWSGSRADFSIEPTAEAGLYKVSYKTTNWHRFFVQLHKAKGGLLFKILAGALAVAFALMFLSGVLLALRNPRLRPLLYTSLGLGFIFFTVASLFS